MKTLLLLLLLCPALVSASLSTQYVNRMADAIKVTENSKRYPFGIKSIQPPAHIKTQAELEAWARRICVNTIRNNHSRWVNAGKPCEFIDFLADKYCPPSVDKIGSSNWRRNVRRLMK